MTRVVFMGTPEFAVPSLRALVESPDFDVVGVVTQPDRPAGRGQQVRESAVKRAAAALGLPVSQPTTLRAPEALAQMRAWSPDMVTVAAFGQILREDVLSLPPLGCVNVHASLLPRWRGAAPIQHAIRAGDSRTGATIMKMDVGLDTGPILLQREISIAPDETCASLHDRLASLGADLLTEALRRYVRGELLPQPQPEEGVTLAPSLSKADGAIDWRESVESIDRQVRAYTPWPGTFTHWQGGPLKVLRGAPLAGGIPGAAAGTLGLQEGAVVVQTGEGLYRLDEVQPAGKRPMSGEAFLAGRPEAVGCQLGK
jgi:methionyl-tRNA formyltransferase